MELVCSYEIGKTVFVRGRRNWRLHPNTIFASLEWRDEGTEYQLRFPTLQERDMVWEVIQNHLGSYSLDRAPPEEDPGGDGWRKKKWRIGCGGRENNSDFEARRSVRY